MQFAGDAAPFVFLRLHQFRREALQFPPVMLGFLKAPLRFPLEPQDSPEGESCKRGPRKNGEQQHSDEARAKGGKEVADLLAAGFKLLFTEFMDTIRKPDRKR